MGIRRERASNGNELRQAAIRRPHRVCRRPGRRTGHQRGSAPLQRALPADGPRRAAYLRGPGRRELPRRHRRLPRARSHVRQRMPLATPGVPRGHRGRRRAPRLCRPDAAGEGSVPIQVRHRIEEAGELYRPGPARRVPVPEDGPPDLPGPAAGVPSCLRSLRAGLRPRNAPAGIPGVQGRGAADPRGRAGGVQDDLRRHLSRLCEPRRRMHPGLRRHTAGLQCADAGDARRRAQEVAAIAACQAAGGSGLEQCITTAQSDAFTCRDTAVDAAKPGFAACTQQHLGCVAACPPS